MPLKVDSKFLVFDALLPDEVLFCSADMIGEFLWAPGILRSDPEFASMARGRDGSVSLPTMAASRLLETTPRLEDPLVRKKLELEDCISHTKKLMKHQPRYRVREV